MEEIKKGKEYPYRVSERREGKYSNKKGKNYYNKEVKSSKIENSKKKWEMLKMRIQKKMKGGRITKRI